MKYILFFFLLNGTLIFAQKNMEFTDEVAIKLAEKPLKCINQQYPNKTAHVINNAEEATLTPADLHPAFYGCLDWHSSVHGHWMLVRILKKQTEIFKKSDEITAILEDASFQADKMRKEADHLTKYEAELKIFERTYGWAWISQLDKELATCG
ncbi:DUF2891 family protein [Halpernia sp. GG3]